MFHFSGGKHNIYHTCRLAFTSDIVNSISFYYYYYYYYYFIIIIIIDSFFRNAFKGLSQEIGDHVLVIAFLKSLHGDKGFTPGSNMQIADKRVAERSKAEYLVIK